MKDNYTILSIETSLDDTCAAVTQDERVLSNVVASQVKFHEEFGGTVPHIARRKHEEWIDKTVDEAIEKAALHPKDIDSVAVTYGPGLAPSLEVGIRKAKELSNDWRVPLLAVNHLEGHLLSSLAKNSAGTGPLTADDMRFPALGFVISGGHTQLVLVKSIGGYYLLGQTLDDAAGEAYDKVARMLKLGYPGGPILSELAKEGEPKYDLPEPMLHRKDLHFSFSGLKTASLYWLKRNNPKLTKSFTADFAASFQDAVIKMLVRRLRRAIKQYKPKMLLLGGGVVSNLEIRKATRKVARRYDVPTYIPYSEKLFTDNAAMIGVAGYFQAQRGDFWTDIDTLDRKPNLNFGSVSVEAGRETT